MAKRPASARKSLTAVNLAALGADRLADLLIQATVGDANLKRKLKLELAAEVGPADLAAELDKRFATLTSSRTRVSWRKRPELIADLQVHRRAIVDRLAITDMRLALQQLVAWFDLYPGFQDRVKDPKGELTEVFFDAAGDLAAIASAAGPDVATPVLAEAIETRLSEWAGWIGRAAPLMNVELARALLAAVTQGKARPTGRRALVVRKLADRAGDAEAWALTYPDEDHAKVEIGSEIARRLAIAGSDERARAALELSRPRPVPSTSRRGDPTPPPSPAWDTAEIAVLEAEGRADDAQAARWAMFERTLDAAILRDFVSRLADFDDVEAIDRAHALAAGWGDASRGLAFLMAWPALREAATMILARSEELNALSDDVIVWTSRLEPRYPNAALTLIRSRACSLARLGPSRVDEVRTLSMEAAELASRPEALEGLESHAAFIDGLDAVSNATGRRFWR